MKQRFLTTCVILAGVLSMGARETPHELGHGSGSSSGAPGSSDIELVSGLGDVRHPISARNPLAVRYFEQGLAYTYAFHHSQAVRSFRKAAKLSPDAAMAWWGIAYALGPNYNRPMDLESAKEAYAAIQKAITLSEGVTQRERDYIMALSERYAADPESADRAALDRKFADAMRALKNRYPDDLDVATLYAESLMNIRPWQLWSLAGEPAEGTLEIVSVLESVLARQPNHIGANHLYIHAVEASPTPERGLASAERLETLAPNAGHLVHMPAHIYMRMGDYNRAADSNEVGAAADEAFAAAHGSGGFYLSMYYSHNLQFLASAYSMAGRYRDALRSSERVERHVGPMLAEMPSAEFLVPTRMFVDIRFRKWDRVLETAEPSREHRMAHALWLMGQGVAHAALGAVSLGRKTYEQFARERAAVPEEAMFNMNKASLVLSIADAVFLGEIARRDGNFEMAIRHYRMAAEKQDRLAYMEPPDWFFPTRETLGALLLMSGQAAEAEKVFRIDLTQNRLNGRSLFGLREALKAQGKDTRKVALEFAEAWKKADTVLRLKDL